MADWQVTADLEVQELGQGEGRVSDQRGGHDACQLGPVPVSQSWVAQGLQYRQVALHDLDSVA